MTPYFQHMCEKRTYSHDTIYINFHTTQVHIINRQAADEKYLMEKRICKLTTLKVQQYVIEVAAFYISAAIPHESQFFKPLQEPQRTTSRQLEKALDHHEGLHTTNVQFLYH